MSIVIFLHIKRDLKDGYDGTGNKKTDEEIIDSSFLNLKSSVNRTKGIVKIRSSYDIDTYAKFLDKTYNSLKFLRKFKEDTINRYMLFIHIFLILNSKMKNILMN